MILLRRILSWPRRRWRARGFGIHSPFAYKFVTTVLGKRCIDNNDFELRTIAGKDYRRYALIYRCVNHFKPKSIVLYPTADERLTRIITLASPSSEIIEDVAISTPEMTIIASEVDNIVDNGSIVCYVEDIDKEPCRSFWEGITADGEYGMDFSDYRMGIMCRFNHLPRQSFKIAFK